ncbi:MAG: DUF5597 domain-containing protein [Acidobacteriaceae bacterium]
MKKLALAALLLAAIQPSRASAQTEGVPHLERRDGSFALVVDGQPFLILGAQINNSSAWPATLPTAWSAAEAMHANTVEAPVYWEQMEPSRGGFDFSNVDLLVTQAREHRFHLILLWLATWKNGQNHYVPEWVKSDPKTYLREENAYGKLLDVMSPSSDATLEADKSAFTALMRHLKVIDGTQHTVLMVQVENESGAIGSVRDFSPAAQKAFEGRVPSDLARALHLPEATWSQSFGADADESFEAYSIAHYINQVAAAGKLEYPIPMYCNVWFAYPVHALENRNRPSPGQEYPSGGPQQANIAIWKAAAPAIDILAPDFYSDDFSLFRSIVGTYARADNPLMVPESQLGPNFGRYFFYALGHGAIGFAPFGIDRPAMVNEPANSVPLPAGATILTVPSQNFALLNPAASKIAQLNLEGRVLTAVEEKGAARQSIHLPTADAVVSFGFPQPDGAYPPGTASQQGRALVAQLEPLEFLVTGFDCSVSFKLTAAELAKSSNQQLEILRAEEGSYVDGEWKATRILNGDETDRGLQFRGGTPPLVRILFHTLPLYDEALHRAQP